MARTARSKLTRSSSHPDQSALTGQPAWGLFRPLHTRVCSTWPVQNEPSDRGCSNSRIAVNPHASYSRTTRPSSPAQQCVRSSRAPRRAASARAWRSTAGPVARHEAGRVRLLVPARHRPPPDRGRCRHRPPGPQDATCLRPSAFVPDESATSPSDGPSPTSASGSSRERHGRGLGLCRREWLPRSGRVAPPPPRPNSVQVTGSRTRRPHRPGVAAPPGVRSA